MNRTFIFEKTCVSTNTELKEKIRRSKYPVWDVISADAQTGGRGRQGKSFYSPAGGVYFSAAFPLKGLEDHIPFLTLLAGLAAAEALEAFGIDVQIKWPNDLYFRGKKLCGILTELVSGPGGLTAVVGAGINVHMKKTDFPPELQHLITSLAAENAPIPEKETLIKEIVSRLDSFVYSENALCAAAPYALRINKRAYLTDKRVKIILENGSVSGTVTGIGPDGSLLLQTENGIKPIRSGTVEIL